MSPFRAFVDERMSAQGIGSVIELADISDVGRDTLYRWFRHESTPTPRAGGRIARALDVSYRDLIGAYEGRTETPGSGDADLGALISEMRDLVAALREQPKASDLLTALVALAEIQGDQTKQIRQNESSIRDIRLVLEALVGQTPLGAPGPSAPQRAKE